MCCWAGLRSRTGSLQYDLSTVSNIPYEPEQGQSHPLRRLGAGGWTSEPSMAQPRLETVDYDAAVHSCPNASDHSFFKMSVEDTTVLRIRPDSELAPSRRPMSI